MDVRPLRAGLVRAADAPVVVAPAYDALTGDQRRLAADAQPLSWLNALRAPVDFSPGESPAPEDLDASNAAYVDARLADGTFVVPDEAVLYVYRMEAHGWIQTGVVAAVPIAEDAAGRVLHHEHTRPERVAELAHYLDVIGVMSSPVCLAYPARPDIDSALDAAASGAPAVRHVAEDGSMHSVWVVAGDEARRLAARFAPVDAVYITDGHHRTAAAARFARERGRDDVGLLVALFPHDRLRILSYNRCVRDLGGLDAGALVAAVSERFDVVPVAGDPMPSRPGQAAMRLDGAWYRIEWPVPAFDARDPAASLDVGVLQDRLLAPVLGVRDPRSDPRVGFVPGVLGVDGLLAREAAGWRVGFAMYPVGIEALIAVADARTVMPPKSTWFDPKARSGLFLARV